LGLEEEHRSWESFPKKGPFEQAFLRMDESRKERSSGNRKKQKQGRIKKEGTGHQSPKM
jgi:hypothetical protein